MADPYGWIPYGEPRPEAGGDVHDMAATSGRHQHQRSNQCGSRLPLAQGVGGDIKGIWKNNKEV